MPDDIHRLVVRALRRSFGPIEAVRDASFEVSRGEVVGLLGPNGAGKSTILDCLAGLLPADGGEVFVDGVPLAAEERHRAMFYLPDSLVPWRDERAGDVVDVFADLWNVDARTRDAWARGAAVALGVEELQRRPIGELSKGQRKRLLLSLALLVPRPLVLMDEPFDGLDLRQVRQTIALLRQTAREGRSLLLSIHAMRDAERSCDRLVLVSDGRTGARGSLGALRAQAGLPAGELEDVFLALT
ncbi:MAG: ABC transporter ATP-binding protein [Gemmatimonadaceae bacterium]|nr:ABC transporter ATP-binding protein [Gemmatimonadaceae bacterium]